MSENKTTTAPVHAKNNVVQRSKFDSGLKFKVIFLEEFNSNYKEEFEGITKFLDVAKTSVPELQVYNKREGNEDMSPEARALLTNFYSSHNQMLEELLNRKLPW